MVGAVCGDAPLQEASDHRKALDVGIGALPWDLGDIDIRQLGQASVDVLDHVDARPFDPLAQALEAAHGLVVSLVGSPWSLCAGRKVARKSGSTVWGRSPGPTGGGT